MATRRLGEILLEKKLIAPQALEHALVEQKKVRFEERRITGPS